MAKVTIKAKHIEDVRPISWNSERNIEIACEMTPDQMCETFGEFLKVISDADFAEWVKTYGLESHFAKEQA